jgi:hypothetical protein
MSSHMVFYVALALVVCWRVGLFVYDWMERIERRISQLEASTAQLEVVDVGAVEGKAHDLDMRLARIEGRLSAQRRAS